MSESFWSYEPRHNWTLSVVFIGTLLTSLLVNSLLVLFWDAIPLDSQRLFVWFGISMLMVVPAAIFSGIAGLGYLAIERELVGASE
jgi:hypothetical protein